MVSSLANPIDAATTSAIAEAVRARCSEWRSRTASISVVRPAGSHAPLVTWPRRLSTIGIRRRSGAAGIGSGPAFAMLMVRSS